MAELKLDLLVIPTYSKYTLGVADASTYPTDPPSVSSATIEVTVPGFGTILKPFSVQDFNVFTMSNLGLVPVGSQQPLPSSLQSWPRRGRNLLFGIQQVDRVAP